MDEPTGGGVRKWVVAILAALLMLAASAHAMETGGSYKYQEKPNYCGIALMQVFVPELSQDEIASELHKSRFDLTYWGDFTYFFNNHGVGYHFTTLGEEFPAIVLLRGTTFGLSQNHYVLVLGRRGGLYSIFDPKRGFYRKPSTYLEGSVALVVEG